MKKFRSLKEFIDKGDKHIVPSLSIDCVILGFHSNMLKVLLVKPKRTDGWALPGGFIYSEEHIDDSAQRILCERTGLKDIFLQQFYVFGKPDRSDKSFTVDAIRSRGIDVPKESWLASRFLSIGYYALVDFEKVHPAVDNISEACEWWDIHHLPAMLMDHLQIFQQAVATVRAHLNYEPIGYNLLPEKFTMPELQKLYETILDQTLDRRNFQRKMLSYGILKKLKERRKGVAHKAPYLYIFDLRKYHKALHNGFQSVW
jgi:ADP-ribose pyrophosphatase YjhB (NUDIX family)